MNYEIYGWLITITLFTLVGLLIGVTWMVAVENGYDKGFKSGYKRGIADTKRTNVKMEKFTVRTHPSMRQKMLEADNEYLMEKVVSLWDKENK
jgi:alpha-ketoglutarate-dependent taurine dioxygenase